MKRSKFRWRCATSLFLALLPTAVGLAYLAADRPYDRVPAFDFADDFYRAGGIEPQAILDRLVAQDERSLEDFSPHPDFADVRILEITGGFDHTGAVLYYTVNGKAMPETFTRDAAGEQAFETANAFHAFIFPKADGDPLSPATSNRRQDNVFDTRNGYFSNNKLGLWQLVFVSWDGPKVDSPACREEMDTLAERNGRDLDGTPAIKTVNEIEHFVDLACIRLRTRALDGSEGFPWVI